MRVSLNIDPELDVLNEEMGRCKNQTYVLRLNTRIPVKEFRKPCMFRAIHQMQSGVEKKFCDD